MSDDAPNPEYDFLHHLQNTLSLVGEHELLPLIERVIDKQVTQADVDRLRNRNITLTEAAKNRLAHLHTYQITPCGDDPRKDESHE